jgi:PAS domain S-box-containing protein
MVSSSPESLDVLVADGEPAFAETVADGLEAINEAVSADAVSSSDAVIKRVPSSGDSTEMDGIVVGDQLKSPLETIEQLPAERSFTVLLLTGSPGDEETITAAVEAGVDDYFSRTPMESQWRLFIKRIVDDSPGETKRNSGWQEPQYEEIFNRINDTVAVFDPDTGEIVDVNETYLDVWGYNDLETIRELGIEGLSATEEGFTEERGRELIREVSRSGSVKTVEWIGETKEGERRWTEAKLTPIEIGNRERVISIQRDITERKRREQEYEQIFNMAGDGIVIHDPETGAVVNANEQVANLLGYEQEAFLDKPLSEFQATEEGVSGEEAREMIRASAETGGREFEWPLETIDGDTVWVRARHEIGEIGGEERVVALLHDVTKRKEREQRIASFHEATRKLTAADSREMACRQAVNAAESVLGFPLVSTHLYDEETGKLSPIAATSRLKERTADLPSFGPGESLPWQVFVEGESVRSSEAAPSLYGPGVAGPDLVLSLGTQGVMLVGAPEESFDAEDIELAQVLAATLEAALNHVAGERALAEREQELRFQQARAERFETLNSVIGDIEQATVEKSSRAGIEEAVCRRLIDIEGHGFVWIAEPTVQDDELVVRTSAGGENSYLDTLDLDLDARGETHPAVNTYQNADVRVVDNVATDRPGGEWRKSALRHGVQSVITVPISYEGTLHGVLTVAGEEPDAFEESIRDVLAGLGQSIGYAITVAERERALESEGTVELEFNVEDKGLFPVRATDTIDCQIQLDRTIRRSGSNFSRFYIVEDIHPDEVIKIADVAPTIESARTVSEGDETNPGVIEVTGSTWFGSMFTDHGAVLREATAQTGEATVVVEAPQGADISALVERFQDEYPETEFVAQRHRERTIRSLFELQDVLQEELTERQWETLQTAYSAGYFEWPRESSGEVVADLLDVTQPTFNQHIRVAEQKAIELLMERDYQLSRGQHGSEPTSSR